MRKFFTTLALASLGACRTAETTAVRFGIAARQSPSQALAYLAEARGIYSAEGLRVTTEEFPGSGKAMEALLGGSVDAISGYHDQILGLPPDAPDTVSFLSLTESHLVAVAAAPGSTRKPTSIADLRGAKVGVTTLGSSTHLLLNHLLRANGLPEDAVTPVAIGTASAALAAMERGVVDAGVVSDFTVRSLEKRGPVAILADTRTPETARRIYGVDHFPAGVLMARRAWLEANPQSARALVRTMRRAREWAVANGAEAVQRALPEPHRGEDPKVHLEALRGAIALLSPDGRFHPEAVERAAVMNPSRRAPATTYTNAYID